MDVSHEMLCGLGEIEDGLQVDDLRAGFSNGGEGMGKQLKVTQVFRDVVSLMCHDFEFSL